MVIPCSIPSLFAGPCFIVILPADWSILVTWPLIKSACAKTLCGPIESARARTRDGIVFMFLSFQRRGLEVLAIPSIAILGWEAVEGLSARGANCAFAPLTSYATVPSGFL